MIDWSKLTCCADCKNTKIKCIFGPITIIIIKLYYFQPSLVNEQLSQLYLDLQLEGAAARLTLEEGITSSSSSGEETTTVTKVRINSQ